MYFFSKEGKESKKKKIQGEPPSFRITKQKKYKNVVKTMDKFINKTCRLTNTDEKILIDYSKIDPFW